MANNKGTPLFSPKNKYVLNDSKWPETQFGKFFLFFFGVTNSRFYPPPLVWRLPLTSLLESILLEIHLQIPSRRYGIFKWISKWFSSISWQHKSMLKRSIFPVLLYPFSWLILLWGVTLLEWVLFTVQTYITEKINLLNALNHD